MANRHGELIPFDFKSMAHVINRISWTDPVVVQYRAAIEYPVYQEWSEHDAVLLEKDVW